MPVIAANRIGEEDGQIFYGHSFITDEWGDFVAEAGSKEPGALVATLDLDRARKHRAGMGFFRDRRPELYGRLVQDILGKRRSCGPAIPCLSSATCQTPAAQGKQ